MSYESEREGRAVGPDEELFTCPNCEEQFMTYAGEKVHCPECDCEFYPGEEGGE